MLKPTQCPSGRVYTEERTRPTTGSGCNEPARETRRICEYKIMSTHLHDYSCLTLSYFNSPGLPTQEELLIIALELGGSGNNYDRIVPPTRPPTSGLFVWGIRPRPDNRRCPHNGRNGQICSHIPGVWGDYSIMLTPLNGYPKLITKCTCIIIMFSSTA